MAYFSIDGIQYPNVFVRTPIKRTATIREGDNSGYMLNGDYYRDIIGTYYTYQLTLDMENSDSASYAALWEVLQSPVQTHTVVLPYNQTTLGFNAYITAVSDKLVKKRDGVNIWRELTITLNAAEAF